MSLVADLGRLIGGAVDPQGRRATEDLLRRVRDGERDLDDKRDLIETSLRSRDWVAVNNAVKVVALLKDGRFADALARLLTDLGQVGFVRRNAADALAGLDDPPQEALDALLVGSQEDYWEIRTSSIRALERFHERLPDLEGFLRPAIEEVPRGWSNLLSQFTWRERNFEVRIAVCSALGACGTTEGTALRLATCCYDPIWKVRGIALEALVRVALRCGTQEALVEEVFHRFDQSCLHFQPRFPLAQNYNRALQTWEAATSGEAG